MGHVIAWVGLACLVLACAIATTVARRLAYGNPRSVSSLSPAEFEVKFHRARSVGWLCSAAWIVSAVLALLMFWPPNGWLVGSLAAGAVLLVAALLGLDDPRTLDVDERWLDG